MLVIPLFHRIFESEKVMDLSNYVVVLTGTPDTLRNRTVPTPESSLSLYQDRLRPHLDQINSSKFILKLDARTPADSMVKPPTSSWRIWVCPRRGAISSIPRAFWKHRQITEKTIYVQSLYFFVPYTFSFWPTCISMHPSDTGFYTSQVLSQIFSINNIIPFFQPPFGSMVVCFIRLFCRRVFPYISRISCIHTAYMTVRIPPSYS